MTADQFRARIEQIYRDLESYSYYDLLNLPPEADIDQIRSMFHRMALSMHPDRHRTSTDEELKQMLYVIYKRVSEGYRVLVDDAQRREYHECLARGERRLVKTERPKPKRAEDTITNPAAKKFFRMAENFARQGDLKNARINYKFTLDLDGDNEALAAKLAEIDAAMNKS